jgi:hypothetical protein
MMDSARQSEMFRAWAKDGLRKKGLKFDHVDIVSEADQEVKRFNQRHQLSQPLTLEEFLELYAELMRELFDEHIMAVYTKLGRLKQKKGGK